MKKVSIVLPCYNEEESLPLYFKAVDEVISPLKDYSFEFVLVNDGSKDKTLSVMESLYEEREDIVICSLSRNYGQNAALSAGLKTAKGDFVIMMDVDLQDPVELIPSLLKKYEEGFEVVNPHRTDRKEDTAFKRDTAGLFYKIINTLEGKQIIPENVNCFRGISRRVVDSILSLTEKDRKLLAEIPLVGYKTTSIDFKREKRQAGKSKYDFKKMLLYALGNMSTITSRPLYFPALFGGISLLLSFFASLIMTVFFILSYPSIHVLGGYEVCKVLLILSVIAFFASLIICFIGVIGIYLHNILLNTRNRPEAFIDFVKRKEEK